jgi:superfamily II DNA/RNA helicase
MIAKGLDFPNVTLVGVINADTALHFPDFRAAERTFQLVTQVAGRTGRGDRGGRVLVQTFSPEHPAIQAAIRHDYDTFAAQELPVRQQFQYPPAATMVRIIVRGPVETEAEEFADTLTSPPARGEKRGGRRSPHPGPGSRADRQTAGQVPLSHPAAKPESASPARGRAHRHRRPETPRRSPMDRRRRPAESALTGVLHPWGSGSRSRGKPQNVQHGTAESKSECRSSTPPLFLHHSAVPCSTFCGSSGSLLSCISIGNRSEFGASLAHCAAGQRPMPLTSHPDMVSRKPRGFGRKNRHVFTGG